MDYFCGKDSARRGIMQIFLSFLFLVSPTDKMCIVGRFFVAVARERNPEAGSGTAFAQRNMDCRATVRPPKKDY